MKQFLIAVAGALALVQSATAAHIGIHGDDVWSVGDGRRLHGPPFGFAGFGPSYDGLDQRQTRFEDRFADLMAQYDTGVASEDYYSSDEYAEIVDDLESLTARYDRFLQFTQRSVDRLDSVIGFASDDLAFLMDLIDEYSSRDDLSAERLDRILARLTRSQERLESKIEALSERHDALAADLDDFTAFYDELSSYAADVVAAGGGSANGDDSTATAALAATPLLAALNDASSTSVATETAGAASDSVTAVPEPAAAGLAAAALLGVALRIGRRKRLTTPIRKSSASHAG